MSKSTKNRKKRSTNMSCGLLKELHALIAFACYNLPSLIKGGASLSDGAIEDVMTSIFYGDDTKNGVDPDLITYVDQFMLGLNKFKGLHTQSLQAGPNGASGEAILSIPEYLHRHKKLLVYAGDGSIEKGILSQKLLFGTGEKISGHTLVRMLKVVLCNCRKMMAIVKSKGSPYRDGAFHPEPTLWGYIPIHDSAGMQSDLFGNAKINASFGRKMTSRAQMRKLLIEQNAATVDNCRGRKRHVTDEEEANNNLRTAPVDPSSTSLQPPPLFDSKSLMYVNSDSWKRKGKRIHS
jgi:hypothetical protein